MITFAFLCMLILLPLSFFAGGIITYVLGINLLAIILMGYDKMAAIEHYSRIPERFLWLTCAIGGSIGCILAMLLFHHKSAKNSFLRPVVVIFLVQIALVVYKIWRTGW